MALQNYTISDLKNLAEILAKSDLLEPTKITKKLDIPLKEQNENKTSKSLKQNPT